MVSAVGRSAFGGNWLNREWFAPKTSAHPRQPLLGQDGGGLAPARKLVMRNRESKKHSRRNFGQESSCQFPRHPREGGERVNQLSVVSNSIRNRGSKNQGPKSVASVSAVSIVSLIPAQETCIVGACRYHGCEELPALVRVRVTRGG